MKNKDKFRIYLDIAIFIGLACICCIEMLISIIFKHPTMKYALVFIYVYLLNLLFYKICTEIADTKFFIAPIGDLVMSTLCTLCLVSTLMHVIYLVYFSMKELYGLGLIELLTNHITYATIVGSGFVLYMAIDNMNNFNKLYMKNLKKH